MITVDVTLHSAIDGHKESLAYIEIFNDGSGTSRKGNYGYRIFGKTNRLMKSGWIGNYPRLSLHVVNLLYRVLKDAVGHKNP